MEDCVRKRLFLVLGCVKEIIDNAGFEIAADLRV